MNNYLKNRANYIFFHCTTSSFGQFFKENFHVTQPLLVPAIAINRLSPRKSVILKF